MIIVDLATISALAQSLLVQVELALTDKFEEKSFYSCLGNLMEAHLTYDPNWRPDMQFCFFSGSQIQLLADNSLQMDGIVYWRYRYTQDFPVPNAMQAILTLDCLNNIAQLDYQIAFCYEDIHRYITPQGIYYEARTNHKLPKPDANYFAQLLVDEYYEHLMVAFLDQIGTTGHKVLRQVLTQYPQLLETIIRNCESGHLLDFADIILMGLDAPEEIVRFLSLKLVEKLAVLDPVYKSYLPSEPQPNIEAFWEGLNSDKGHFSMFEAVTRNAIQELISKDPEAMARFLNSLGIKRFYTICFSMLVALKEKAAPAIPKLKELLEKEYSEQDKGIVIQIYRVLYGIGTPEALATIDQALNGSESMKEDALLGIGYHFPTRENAPDYYKDNLLRTLIEALKDDKTGAGTYYNLINSLSSLRSDPKIEQVFQQAVPILINKLLEVGNDDKLSILLTLSNIGKAAQEAIPYLLDIFWHPPTPRFTEEEKEIMHELNQDTSDSSEVISYLQLFAISALRSIKVATPEVIQAFQRALTLYNIYNGAPDSDQYDLSNDAVWGLSKLGEVRVVVEALRTVEDPGFINSYIVALSYLDEDPNLVPELLAAMSDSKVYYYGLQIFAGLGQKAIGALPNLLNWLQDETSQHRPLVAVCLGAIGEAASPAIPTLAALLWQSELPLRLKAAQALGQIGKASLSAILAALEESDKLDPVTICWLIKALGDSKPASEDLVSIQKVLSQWQDNKDVRINFLAQQALDTLNNSKVVLATL